MASVINATGHGLVAGDCFYFTAVEPDGTGVDWSVPYYVLPSGLTADTFEFSTSVGGTPFVLNTNITNGRIVRGDTYEEFIESSVEPPVVATPITPIYRESSRPTLPNDAYPNGTVIWDESEQTLYKNIDGVWTSMDGVPGPPGSVPSYPGEPTLPDDLYPVDTLLYDTSAHLLKKNVNGTWVNLINATDLTGKIGASQIDTNAIRANHILAGEINASHLTAELVLTSKLATASSGQRVEMDILGFRAYNSVGKAVVNIPTAGSVTFNADVEASTLTVTGATEFQSSVNVGGGVTMTVASGVSNPTAPPTLTTYLSSSALASAPSGHGIFYDSSGYGTAPTWWIGCDPNTESGAVAKEYRVSDGVLLRTITKSDTSTTTTETVGTTTHVSDTAEATSGTTNSQIATPLTIPTRTGTIKVTAVSAYFAGYGGACTVRNMLWNTSGVMLGRTSSYSVPSATFSAGNSVKYNKTLAAPVTVSSGDVVWAGFLRTGSGDGFQWDRDDGSYTTKKGSGLDGDMASITTDSAHKPNVYITIEVTSTTTVEGTMGKVVGVTRVGSYIYVLDSNGKMIQYNQSTLAYVGQTTVSATVAGLDSASGLFTDGTYVIVSGLSTTSGTGVVKFYRYNTSMVYVDTITSTGLTLGNTATGTVRGGYSDGTRYWVAIKDSTYTGVYAYTISTGALVAYRNFGLSGEIDSGVAYDGTVFRGWVTGLSKVWTFTAWDWSTDDNPYWVAYTWYDDNATGGTHETGLSPKASISIGRRRNLTVSQPAIPTGAAPDGVQKVRVYIKKSATSPSDTSMLLQVADALTVRSFSSDTSSGAAPSATNFSTGSAASIASSGTGWTLKGGGSINRTGTAFPASPATGDHYYRSDLGHEFMYNGTRWLSTVQHKVSMDGVHSASISASAANLSWAGLPLMGCSDIWIDSIYLFFLVASGGTALGASHNWAIVLQKGQDASASFPTIATLNINSGTSGVQRSLTDSTGWLLNNGTTYDGVRLGATKTGTPGALYIAATISYRLVAT